MNSTSGISRRSFVKKSSTAGTALAFYGAAAAWSADEPPSSRMRIAVMGLGRGLQLVSSSLKIPNTEVVYLCDVDDDRIAQGMKVVQDKQKQATKPEKDVRRLLENKNLDALFIAAPNHWHAPASILACVAGKHVYVENLAAIIPGKGR